MTTTTDRPKTGPLAEAETELDEAREFEAALAGRIDRGDFATPAEGRSLESLARQAAGRVAAAERNLERARESDEKRREALARIAPGLDRDHDAQTLTGALTAVTSALDAFCEAVADRNNRLAALQRELVGLGVPLTTTGRGLPEHGNVGLLPAGAVVVVDTRLEHVDPSPYLGAAVYRAQQQHALSANLAVKDLVGVHGPHDLAEHLVSVL